MSNQETSFVTIGQRILANPLRLVQSPVPNCLTILIWKYFYYCHKECLDFSSWVFSFELVWPCFLRCFLHLVSWLILRNINRGKWSSIFLPILFFWLLSFTLAVTSLAKKWLVITNVLNFRSWVYRIHCDIFFTTFSWMNYSMFLAVIGCDSIMGILIYLIESST